MLTPRTLLRAAVTCLMLSLLAGSLPPRALVAQEAAAVSAVVPPGFVYVPLVSGLNLPVDMTFLPDGDILVAEKGYFDDANKPVANVRLVRNGQLQPEPVITLSAAIDRDSGLFGIAADPNFDENHWFYVWYAAGPEAPAYPGRPVNRLARLTLNPATGRADPASYKMILDGVLWSPYHNGGALLFVPDGTLFISTGDANQGSLVSRLDSLNGKLLRIRPTADGYTIPQDNPYVGQPDARPEVYARGLRNPFRLARDPATGVIVVGDVGQSTWEEINLVEPGVHYGWTQREGPCPRGEVLPCAPAGPEFTNPIAWYQHAENQQDDGGAVTGLAWYAGDAYPAEYRGRLFYTDYDQDFVGWMQPEGPPHALTLFGHGITSIVDMEYWRNNLYLLDIFPGGIYRLVYTGSGNQAPTAVLEASTNFGPAPLAVSFSGEGSSDADDPTLLYRWDFGDGATLETESPTVRHTYQADGLYLAELTVVDSRGAPSSPAQQSITVYSGEMPTIELTIENAPARTLYHGGDSVRFRAVRSSSSGLDPARPWTWDVELHHNQHTHPEMTGFAGSSGEWEIPRENHGGEVDIWYRFSLTMHTTQGQSITVHRDLQPAVTAFQVTTAGGAPGQVVVDGVRKVTPLEADAIPGTTYTLEALPELVMEQGIYTFDHWQSPALPGGESAAATLPFTVTVAPQTHTLHYTFTRAASVQQLPLVNP